MANSPKYLTESEKLVFIMKVFFIKRRARSYLDGDGPDDDSFFGLHISDGFRRELKELAVCFEDIDGHVRWAKQGSVGLEEVQNVVETL